MIHLTAWSLPALMTALFALIAFRQSPLRAEVPGGPALKVLFGVISAWALTQALATVISHSGPKLILTMLADAGSCAIALAWFLFALSYSQRVLHISSHTIKVICLIPALTAIFALTNNYHHLVWPSWEHLQTGSYSTVVLEHGILFYLNTVYTYGITLMGTAILAFALSKTRQKNQTMLVIIFTPLLGVLANAFYLSPYNSAPWFDITTIGILGGVLLLDYGVIRSKILLRSPIYREQVVEQLSDPVLVIANDGRILDANLAATAAWQFGTDTLIHTNLRSIAQELYWQSPDGHQQNSEVSINQVIYEVGATKLDNTNRKSDWALVFRDVTERRKAESELRDMRDTLQKMAHTDALTGLFNRRYFMQRLPEEFERVKRHNNMLSILVFDLDHFKLVNDTHGHDCGDSVLIAIGEVVSKVKRTSDVACRIGGEEFAMLLPETNQAGALQLAQRLCQEIEQFDYSKYTDKKVSITASVGVATVNQSSVQPETILKSADRALYKAKRGGRNKVCME